jgi:glycosyltransferase involved in cell wall biosynthesis
MDSNPLVTVIMIFFNGEKFIEEAIESVLAQTYENWELLLVDDGSSDRSTEIALRYAQQYPQKVRYLEHEAHQNRGTGASRNLGITNAKGKYINFLDADDVSLSNTLKEQVEIMESQAEAVLVCGNTQWWYGWTGNLEDIQRDYVREIGAKPNTLLKPPTLLTLFLRREATIPCNCSVLLRREVVERIGGFDEEFQGEYEDQAFYAKCCLEAPVFVVSRCWGKYRQHPKSTCAVAKKTGQHYATRLMFLTWLEEYLSRQEVKNIEVWQALQGRLWSYRHPILHRLSGRVEHFARQMKGLAKLIAQRTLPISIYCWLREQWQGGGLAK